MIEAESMALVVLAGLCVWAFCDFERTLRSRLERDQDLDLNETLLLGCRYLSRRV